MPTFVFEYWGELGEEGALLRDLGEFRKLPQRGPGQSPGHRRIFFGLPERLFRDLKAAIGDIQDLVKKSGRLSRSTGFVTYTPCASRDALTHVASTCGQRVVAVIVVIA